MTPEEKRQGAFEEFEELLTQRLSIDEALVRAAEDNELKPDVFRAIAEKQLGDLGEYRGKLQLRALNAAINAEVKRAASKRHLTNAFHDCFDLDEVAAKVEDRIGRPITDPELSKIRDAYKEFIVVRVRELVGK